MLNALRATFLLALMTGCSASGEFANEDGDVSGDEAAVKSGKKAASTPKTPPKDPPVRFTVLQHNVGAGVENDAGAAGLDYTFDQIDETRPDVVALEEVCIGQLDIIRAKLAGWTVSFSPMSQAHRGCGYQQKGQVLATRHPITDETETELGDPDPSGNKHFTLRCGAISHPKATRKVTVCVTHLRAGGLDPDAADLARGRQVQRIKELVRERVQANEAVVVAGDLNAGPKKETLDPLYRLTLSGGTDGGHFDEADQTDPRREKFAEALVTCAAQACRSGENTTDGGKLDHVFFSHNRVAGELHADVLGRGGSDHSLYLAYADLDI